ncbi:head completion/stabilization protein [Pseudomonas sp. RIT-PI-S]|uniref:head completion/stabilization protein n=1 Tax=Pseudomonas sp. RIT-PI-S TaxID=3035295 RepID=UPI0021DA68AD|nr:head completion/stabilization protein [Pseudomonas sp. RIT-PI-S]
MSGFIAGGPVASTPLDNDGFWPNIDAGAVTTVLRLDGSVPVVRLEQAVLNAMLSLNRELRALKARYRAEGFTTLAQVPAEQVGGESEWLLLYRRAVYCAAGAELCERYRSYDSTGEGHNRADVLAPTVDEYRRDYRYAVRDLLGNGHATVELI